MVEHSVVAVEPTLLVGRKSRARWAMQGATRGISGTAHGEAQTLGDLTIPLHIDGVTSGSAAVTATILGSAPILATTAGTATVTGKPTVNIRGAVAAKATVASQLISTGSHANIAGSAYSAGSTSLAAALKTSSRGAAAVFGTATYAQGILGATVRGLCVITGGMQFFGAAATGTSHTTGDLQKVINEHFTSNGTSTAAATLHVNACLQGSAGGMSEVVGEWLETHPLPIDGSSTVTVDTLTDIVIGMGSFTIATHAVVEAILSQVMLIGGDTTGSASTTADLYQSPRLATPGPAFGRSTVTGTLTGQWPTTAAPQGRGRAAGTAYTYRERSTGKSTVAGSLQVATGGSAHPAGVAHLQATATVDGPQLHGFTALANVVSARYVSIQTALNVGRDDALVPPAPFLPRIKRSPRTKYVHFAPTD